MLDSETHSLACARVANALFMSAAEKEAAAALAAALATAEKAAALAAAEKATEIARKDANYKSKLSYLSMRYV